MQDKTATITPLFVCFLVTFSLLSLYSSSSVLPILPSSSKELLGYRASILHMPHGSLMPPRFSLASAVIYVTYMTTVLND